MPSDGDAFVSLPNVRAISDGLSLMCEMEGGRRIAIPLYEIGPGSEVRRPGDFGTLVVSREIAEFLRLA